MAMARKGCSQMGEAEYGGDRNLNHAKMSATGVRCPVCDEARGMLHQALSGDLHFSAAFTIWMSHRTLKTNGLRTDASYLSRRTELDYLACARALEKFPPFQELRLGEIAPRHLMEYQRARALNEPDPKASWSCLRARVVRAAYASREAAEGWAKKHGGGYSIVQTVWSVPAGANRIRKEIALMIRVLRDARLWGQEQEDSFLRLRPVESEMVRAMTVEEQHRFLHTAASRQQFRLVYQYAIVALQTTASTNELRALRLADVVLADRIIQIPRAGAKNKYRLRAIPIVTEDCMWALEGLIARARELGSVSPSHYLFPLRIARGKYDPSQPMSDSGLKKQWDAMRTAALLPDLRIYDLRHTGITRMAEAGVPLPVAMTFAGHMTAQMQQRYTAICMASQRGWGATVWGDGALRTGGPASVAHELTAAWPSRKPVAAETVQRYQEVQHFHKKA